MTIIPRIVINKCCSVSHPCDLVAVIPPRHHSSVFVRVLTQPIVSLPEVVQNVAGTVKKEGLETEYSTLSINKLFKIRVKFATTNRHKLTGFFTNGTAQTDRERVEE